MLDFLIVYEHKARELDNVCLLKAELELRGYSVEIIQSKELVLFRYRFSKKPKVLVTFALYEDVSFEAHVNGLVGNINKVINLQWEQIFSTDTKSMEFHTPRGKAALATHICWGEGCYKRLKNAGVDHAVLTGAVQMDFLEGKLKNYYMTRQEIEEKYHLPKDKKMILYISSFVASTATSREKEIARKKIGDSVDIQEELSVISKKRTLEILRTLLENHSEYYVVFRPHPGELIDDRLSRMIKEYDDFFVISEESVKQWILSADHIVTWCSTAIAEVYYARRSCIVLRPVPIPKNIECPLYLHVNSISSYNELELKLKEDGYEFPVPKEDIFYFYGTISVNKAYVNVVDLMERVYHTAEYDIQGLRKKLYLKYPIKNLIKRIIIALNITDETWPFCRIERIKGWLSFFESYRKKDTYERVEKEKIEEITGILKQIIR